jgi:hypothetical protein
MQLARYRGLDLSDLSSNIDPKKYKRLRKTHIRVLSAQVPESFIERFEDRETALSELLDAIYGTMDQEDDDV